MGHRLIGGGACLFNVNLTEPPGSLSYETGALVRIDLTTYTGHHRQNVASPMNGVAVPLGICIIVQETMNSHRCNRAATSATSR